MYVSYEDNVVRLDRRPFERETEYFTHPPLQL
jgi:hypothetical protein